MAFDWLIWSNPVTLWWIFLVSVSFTNILALLWTFRYLQNKGQLSLRSATRKLVWLSTIYVFCCAFRSILPRADVQKICLFDTWLSSVLLGRTVATIAEVSFVCQWAIILNRLSTQFGSKIARSISLAIVPVIITAECFSWYAVISTHYFGNMVEESLWGITYFLIAISLLVLRMKFNRPTKLAVTFAIVGSLIYVLFMATVDVPMYFNRWQSDLSSRKLYFGFVDGIHELATQWVVTHDIQLWRDEIPWMSLYFSIAVWTSIALCYVPLSISKK